MSVEFRKLIIIIAEVAFLASPAAGTNLMDEKRPIGGWWGFGTGFVNISKNTKKNILMELTWRRAKWGVGMWYVFPTPIDYDVIDGVEVDVKTRNGTETSIYAALSTGADATVSSDRARAEIITDEWKTCYFPVAKMKSERPDFRTPEFVTTGNEKIENVKLLFTKPTGGDIGREVIAIRNPRLILKE